MHKYYNYFQLFDNYISTKAHHQPVPFSLTNVHLHQKKIINIFVRLEKSLNCVLRRSFPGFSCQVIEINTVLAKASFFFLEN